MQQLKLLLLEDDPADADLIKKILQRSGMKFNATVTTDKKEFIFALNNDTFDAVLADNSLPQFNALGALKIIKEYNLQIPFILVTGTISEDYAVSIMKEGAADYVLKDRLQRLPNAILSAINKHFLEKQQQKNLDELIKKEALMKESEQLAHLGSWEFDLLSDTAFWSDETYRILDYKRGEIEASMASFLGRIHPDDWEYVDQTIENAIAELDRQKFNCRIVTKDGAVKNLENEIFITRNNMTTAIRINGISRDVTETILANERMQRSEANLRTIFDNTDTGYVLLDNRFNIVSFNKPMNKISVREFGRALTEGGNIAAYVSVERLDRILRYLQNALKGNHGYYEIPYPQPNGSSKWYYVTYHPVWNSSMTIIGVVVSQTDITRRKSLELQERKITSDLIQRNNDLEQFTYIVSHNLRGPVATILGISDLINDPSVTEEEKKFFIEGLASSVRKLDDVIVDLNSIIHTKKAIEEKKELVNFSQLVDEVVAAMPNVNGEKALDIRKDFSEVEAMVSLKSYLYSIFFNLISNSIKYKQAHVPLSIKIKSRRSNDKVELIFRDNGMGIDLQKKGDQVFGLYKRFHPQHAEGKGMGLFMVKTQVETLGGKISIESEVNIGTQFRIEFELPELTNKNSDLFHTFT